jgi:hypothetical protein
MIRWLDHLIFGNGRGLKTPYFDAVYYWVGGRVYSYSAGFGAQLYSIQWRHPKIGEQRRINGRVYRPFHSNRRWGRVMVSWATDLGCGDQVATLRQIKDELNNL